MYVLNTEKVFYDEADGESIVINFTTGNYYCFNAAGAVVFKYLIDGGDPQITALKDLHGLKEFIEILLDKDILQTEDAPYSKTAFDCSGINGSETPAVTEYDEVRNLILADPVDDVRLWE